MGWFDTLTDIASSTYDTVSSVAKTAGGVASVVGTGMSMYSSYQAGQASEDQAAQQASYTTETAAANATLSRYDANVSRLNAYQTRLAENQTIKLHRDKVSQYVSKQKANYSKSGVAVGKGTPVDVMDETIKQGQADEYTIRTNYNNKALSYESLANRYDMLASAGLRDAATYASMLTAAGESKATSYNIQAIGTAVSSFDDIVNLFD